ncbi:MAG: hypothetical protein LBB79_05355 [Prevotellaceae bacterium]|jgi:hypothetical protein|nr:hypothetical protein [Prevotellaceae bacterium]
MNIANPIYDTVFKFMMEDERVAKSFISAIIGEKVLDLGFSAQERTVYVPKEKVEALEGEQKEEFLTVCRFDFSAKIELPDNRFKTVMIELQKAKFSSDIMRFRRYVGAHYQNESNVYKADGGSDGDNNEVKPRQIYCIFLLGYDFGMPGHPVVQVDSTVRDRTTSEVLSGTNEFIEGLHHRSWIVQLDQLKRRRRDDLEMLLSIFDQENRTQDHHIMNVDESTFPEAYRAIIRRLRMASESKNVRIEMEMEDDYWKGLQERERLIARQKKALIDKDKIIAGKDKALEEQKQAIAGKDKTLEEQNKIIEALKRKLGNSQS